MSQCQGDTGEHEGWDNLAENAQPGWVGWVEVTTSHHIVDLAGEHPRGTYFCSEWFESVATGHKQIENFKLENGRRDSRERLQLEAPEDGGAKKPR